MLDPGPPEDRGRAAALLYRSTCGKCRVLSRLVVCLSLGRLRRIPLTTPEAEALYAEHGEKPGKLALIVHRRIFTGWQVIPGFLAWASGWAKQWRVGCRGDPRDRQLR